MTDISKIEKYGANSFKKPRSEKPRIRRRRTTGHLAFTVTPQRIGPRYIVRLALESGRALAECVNAETGEPCQGFSTLASLLPSRPRSDSYEQAVNRIIKPLFSIGEHSNQLKEIRTMSNQLTATTKSATIPLTDDEVIAAVRKICVDQGSENAESLIALAAAFQVAEGHYGLRIACIVREAALPFTNEGLNLSSRLRDQILDPPVLASVEVSRAAHTQDESTATAEAGEQSDARTPRTETESTFLIITNVELEQAARDIAADPRGPYTTGGYIALLEHVGGLAAGGDLREMGQAIDRIKRHLLDGDDDARAMGDDLRNYTRKAIVRSIRSRAEDLIDERAYLLERAKKAELDIRQEEEAED